MSLKVGESFYLAFVIPQVELLAGTSIELYAPFDGYIEELATIVQTAVTTGGVLTVEINTVEVAGLGITVADAATKGTRQIDTPTKPSPTRQFKKGDRIELQPSAAFATAGALNGHLKVRASGTISA